LPGIPDGIYVVAGANSCNGLRPMILGSIPLDSHLVSPLPGTPATASLLCIVASLVILKTLFRALLITIKKGIITIILS